ncbi:MAG TPA: peptidylprolyl isomerase [Puia sp.]|nr:peptidylprolyl isomerase [Puia sp.]
MRKLLLLAILTGHSYLSFAQKMATSQIKMELEKSPNPPLYVKDVLKKKFKLDTIVVTRTAFFRSIADSLAYTGKIKKVYGPYDQNGKRFLAQILAKSPNTFYRVSQIFIDTSMFSRKFADSLGNSILQKLKAGTATFEQLARTYSMGGETLTSGDLGWVARGILLPTIEHEVAKSRKGDVFKIWSSNGLHIIKKTEDPKQDTGFALMMIIFL